MTHFKTCVFFTFLFLSLRYEQRGATWRQFVSQICEGNVGSRPMIISQAPTPSFWGPGRSGNIGTLSSEKLCSLVVDLLSDTNLLPGVEMGWMYRIRAASMVNSYYLAALPSTKSQSDPARLSQLWISVVLFNEDELCTVHPCRGPAFFSLLKSVTSQRTLQIPRFIKHENFFAC